LSLSNTANDLFFIDTNSSLWLRNTSVLPGIYDIEFIVRNHPFETRKTLRILLTERRSFGWSLWWKNVRPIFTRLSRLFVILVLICLTSLSITFVLIYTCCWRSNVRQRLYGSRLIVNDEDKSKQNSPQTTNTSTVLPPSISNLDSTISRNKQRKVMFTS
jgi:hypothetical protein